MPILERLLSASYKNVSFLVTSADTPGGFKFVKHVFPNSSNQIIEELGVKQRTYNITAIISGDDYFERRNRFLEVLEEGGVGILVHPLYGTLNNIKATNWTPIEDFNSLGEFKISIVFEVDTGQSIPVEASNTISTINQSNELVTQEVDTNVTNNYFITNTFTENFTDAINQANDVVDYFNKNTSFLAVDADKIDTFSNELSNFSSNIVSLIKNPQDLVDSISNLFNIVDGLYPTIESTLTVFKKFFDFGDSDSEIKETTTIRLQRKNNRDLIRSTMQVQALSYSYLNVSQIQFSSIVDLNENSSTLEDQYQKVINLDGLSDRAISAITDMRVEVQEFFKRQRITINQIVSIDTKKTSTRLLSFQYYGSTDNADTISSLNSLTDISYISGKLDIITA